MAQSQARLEAFFTNPHREYQDIIIDLQKRLHNDICQEIVAFVEMKTNKAMEQVWNRLKNRYNELSKLEETMPDNPTKEDQNHYIKEFFRLTDPSKVSWDLQDALKFDKLEKEYLDFIKQMATQEYGELFKRYVYPSPFFHAVRNGILHHIVVLTDSLKTYTEAIGNHALLLDELNRGKRDKAIIKGGATLLGMLIGVPFAGAGVGALMGGNDHTQLTNSLEKVFTKWNSYIANFNHFLKELEDHYRLAMMTIYGGTILRVNDQLNVYHYTFQTMALISGHYYLTITESERKDTEDWMRETTSGIQKLILQKNWQNAIKVSMELFQIVKQRPVVARAELYDGKSALYIAHLYYSISYQEALLQEYRNGHKDSFFETCKKLYSEMPLLILDSDIDHKFSKQAHLLFRFIKEGLQRGRLEDLKVVVSYLQRIVNRWETEGSYLGENAPSIRQIKEESKALLLAEQFLEDVLGIALGNEDSAKEPRIHFTTRQLKELLEIDNEIGTPDELTQYLKSLYIKSFLFPWRNFSLDWVASHSKKLMAAVLAGVLISGGVTYGPEIYDLSKERVSSLQMFQDNEQEQLYAKTPEQAYITLTVFRANIRETPSLNGKVITVVGNTEKILYLNEKQIGDDGENWYFVKLPDGNQGWISSTVSEK